MSREDKRLDARVETPALCHTIADETNGEIESRRWLNKTLIPRRRRQLVLFAPRAKTNYILFRVSLLWILFAPFPALFRIDYAIWQLRAQGSSVHRGTQILIAFPND